MKHPFLAIITSLAQEHSKKNKAIFQAPRGFVWTIYLFVRSRS